MLDMIEKLERAVRWAGVRLSIARGFLAYWLYWSAPTHKVGAWGRLGWAALPYAGDYAFATDPWVKERRAYWIRTGEHMPTTPADEDQFFRALSQKEEKADGR